MCFSHPTLKRVNSIILQKFWVEQWFGRMLYTTASQICKKNMKLTLCTQHRKIVIVSLNILSSLHTNVHVYMHTDTVKIINVGQIMQVKMTSPNRLASTHFTRLAVFQILTMDGYVIALGISEWLGNSECTFRAWFLCIKIAFLWGDTLLNRRTWRFIETVLRWGC